MAREQQTFTTEFKLEAVRLAQMSGKSTSQVAREQGVADSMLFRWCKQLAEHREQPFPSSGHQTALEEENRRLRQELEIREAASILC